MEVAQGWLQDEGGAGRARAAFAPVTGQGVEGSDPDLRVGVVGHGGKLVHGLGIDQMVKEATAAFPDSRALMLQAVPDCGHRTLAAPQQHVISADGALRIAQGFDESLIVGSERIRAWSEFHRALSKPQLISAGCPGCDAACGTLITSAGLPVPASVLESVQRQLRSRPLPAARIAPHP